MRLYLNPYRETIEEIEKNRKLKLIAGSSSRCSQFVAYKKVISLAPTPPTVKGIVATIDEIKNINK